MTPILWQRIEGALVLAGSLLLSPPYIGDWSYLALVGWFFAPDLFILAYGLGNRIGAAAYNCVHIYGFGAAVFALGLLFESNAATVLGLLWLAHAGFDRVLGYGLKLDTGFGHTHMGPIGKDKNSGD